MRLLAIISGAGVAFAALAQAAAYKWDGVPYMPISNPTTVTAAVDGTGLTIAFGGTGWVQYQPSGQLALQPAQHGDIATLTLTWERPVGNIAIDITGLINGNFVHLASAAFTLNGQSVAHESVNLHSVQEQGGWLANVVQWNHEGRATVVADSAADSVTLSFTTRPGTSAAAPYYSTITVPQITWTAPSPVPEPAHLAYLITGALVGLLVVRHLIRRHR